jgi:hypothetical protein
VLQKIEHVFCESDSLKHQAHSPNWFEPPTDSHRRDRRKGVEDHLHTRKDTKQSLSDYDQLD